MQPSDMPSPVTDQVRTGSRYLDYSRDGYLELRKSALICTGTQRMEAERVRYHPQSGTGELHDALIFPSSGIRLHAAEGRFDLRTDVVELDKASIFLDRGDFELRSSARTLRYADGDIAATTARITSCPADSETWVLSGSSLRTLKNRLQGRMYNAVLRLGKVPVFYSPLLAFPIGDTRQSGLLPLGLDYDSDSGMDLSIPYYFNLAPHYDMTLAARILTSRGVAVQGQFRHLARHMRNEFTGMYMFRDRLYNGELARENFADTGSVPFRPAPRWHFAWQHRGIFGSWLHTQVDYTRSSDKDLFRSLGNAGADTAQGHLRQTAALALQGKNTRIGLQVQAFQPLESRNDSFYRKMPELYLRHHRTISALDLDLIGTATRFTRKHREKDAQASPEGNRFHLESRLTLALTRPYGEIKLTGALHQTHYDLDAGNSRSSFDRSILTGSMTAGLKLERHFPRNKDTMVQTLETYLYYLWSETDKQDQLPLFDTTEQWLTYRQLFRENRFSGFDRISDENRLAVGLVSRLRKSTHSTNLLTLRNGMTYHFRNRTVTLGDPPAPGDAQRKSALVSEIDWQVNRRLNFTGTWLYSTEDRRTDELSLQAGFRGQGRNTFNLGYRERSPTMAAAVRQSQLSMHFSLNDRLAFGGAWYYDLLSNQDIELTLGATYSTCCWQLRTYWRRERRNFGAISGSTEKSGIFVQIVLRGLGQFGSDIDDMLHTAIPGYRAADF